MQFVGFFQWRKRGAGGSHDKMKARRFKGKQWLWYSLLFLAGLALSYFILNEIGKSAYVGQDSAVISVLKLGVLMDAFSAMCNILGQLLMSTAYMEQWVFWIGVNISSVIMWSVSLAHSSDSYALIYLIKYSFYLLNSLDALKFSGIFIYFARNLLKLGRACKSALSLSCAFGHFSVESYFHKIFTCTDSRARYHRHSRCRNARAYKYIFSAFSHFYDLPLLIISYI